jgi:hypothetical protein
LIADELGEIGPGQGEIPKAVKVDEKDDKKKKDDKDEKKDEKKSDLLDGIPDWFVGPLLADLVQHEVAARDRPASQLQGEHAVHAGARSTATR